MNQSVIAFSNSTARSSAITSPVEGMITYLEDSNSYQSWDGSAWVGLVPQSPNAIINGAFEINQRQVTSTTTTTTFPFDRWLFQRGTGGTVTGSSETFSPGSAPLTGLEGTNFYRVVTAGQTDVGDNSVTSQRIENVRSITPSKSWTVSFYARAASGTPKIAVEGSQNFGSGGTSTNSVLLGQVTLSTSWERKTVTFTPDSISGKTIGPNSYFQTHFWMSAGSNFNSRTGSLGNQNNTFEIWGVQLEEGPVATPFKRNANSLQGELAACQRYYQRFGGDSAFQWFGIGQATSTTVAKIVVNSPVSMRIAPQSMEFGGTLSVSDATTTTNSTSVVLFISSRNLQQLNVNVASGLTNFRPYHFLANNDSNAFIAFNAEL
jgi:hypothetical protein